MNWEFLLEFWYCLWIHSWFIFVKLIFVHFSVVSTHFCYIKFVLRSFFKERDIWIRNTQHMRLVVLINLLDFQYLWCSDNSWRNGSTKSSLTLIVGYTFAFNPVRRNSIEFNQQNFEWIQVSFGIIRAEWSFGASKLEIIRAS